MGIVFRQSVKTSIVIFLGAFLGAFTIWLSTNYISKQELGFVRALTTYSVVGTQLLLLGIQNTLGVYIHQYKDNLKKKGVLLTACLTLPIVILLFSSLFYFVFKSSIIPFFRAEDIPFISKYFGWLPVFTLLMMYQVVFEQYLSSQLVVALSAFVREVVIRVVNIVLIVLFAFNFINFDFFVALTVLAYLIPISIYIVLSLRTDAFVFSLDYKAFSKAEILDVVKFTWYHSLLSISMTLMSFLDTMMLTTLDKNGLVSLAIYGNAIFFISVLQMPYKAMFTATFPILAGALKDGDSVKVSDLFTRSSLNMLIGGVFMAIVIMSNLNGAIALMPAGYEVVKPLVAILIIGSFADMATGMNGQILSISPLYRFNFYVSIILVIIMILLNLILIPKIGIYGAAWANSIALMIFNVIKFLYVWKKMDLQPFTKKSVLVILAGIPPLLIGYYFPYLFNPGRHIYIYTFIDVAIRTSIIVITYLLMLIWLKPSSDLEEYISSVIKNKRLF